MELTGYATDALVDPAALPDGLRHFTAAQARRWPGLYVDCVPFPGEIALVGPSDGSVPDVVTFSAGPAMEGFWEEHGYALNGDGEGPFALFTLARPDICALTLLTPGDPAEDPFSASVLRDFHAAFPAARPDVGFDLCGIRPPWVVFAPQDSAVVRTHLDALSARGGRIHRFDARDFGDPEEVFRAFARELRFPDHFGHNWDAFVDCLDDLCAAATDGVGLAGVIHGADVLLDAPFLRTFVSVLCQGAARANSAVDLDGEALHRPAIAEHFVFLLDELAPGEFIARIEHEDLIVRQEPEGFVTVTLNPEVWFPAAGSAWAT